MTFGQNLIQLREAQGYSRKDFAERLGIPYTTLRNYETDAREPGHKLLIKIASLLSISVDELVGFTTDKTKSAPAYSAEALQFLRLYELASPEIKSAVKAVLSVVGIPENYTDRPRSKKIYLFGQSFAAGTAEPPSDMFYQEYETDDMRADFAIHINGDSMEPYLHDGSIALGVKRLPKDGEVGAFFLDGGFLVKQVCVDSYNNVYLFSLNRERSDADETIWHNAGRDFQVVGTILMDKRIPLPDV